MSGHLARDVGKRFIFTGETPGVAGKMPAPLALPRLTIN
jgi:hypothetical protein